MRTPPAPCPTNGAHIEQGNNVKNRIHRAVTETPSCPRTLPLKTHSFGLWPKENQTGRGPDRGRVATYYASATPVVK